MAWRKGRIYKCAFCGDEKPSNQDYPPFGWKGSESKHGDCYCIACSRSISEKAEDMKKFDIECILNK